VTTLVATLACAGCGAVVDPREPYPFRCPNAGRGDDIDHVLRRRLDPDGVEFPHDDAEPNPFLRYRRLLHTSELGLPDEELFALVRSLDRKVACVDGHGFAETPFEHNETLSDALGFSCSGGIWVKDETANVSGSHKARHLFGVLVHLAAIEALGLSPGARPELAIASCGNAALAAAVVAAAGGYVLRVFVPESADPVVLARLERLGACIERCRRVTGQTGDPAYGRLLEALAAGALPFTCQGNLNGLAVEAGETLGYELVSTGVGIDRLVVQVGGGALASACIEAFVDAVALGAIDSPPRIDTVQTHGAWPLRRAYELVEARARETGDREEAIRYAAAHRSKFMWPWETEPLSVAHGILDDETYDWLAVVEGMLATGGDPVVVDEETIVRANELAREATGIDVDPTGSSGLAGLLAQIERGVVDRDERVALLFTGVRRSANDEES
jgi:threonine synthase